MAGSTVGNENDREKRARTSLGSLHLNAYKDNFEKKNKLHFPEAYAEYNPGLYLLYKIRCFKANWKHQLFT